MKFITITDSRLWEGFQRQHPWTQFTQSWSWGEFRRMGGCKVRRFALVDKKSEWLCAAQLEYRQKFPGVGYWFAPRGPVFRPDQSSEENVSLLEAFVSRLKTESRPRGLFTRLEPVIVENGNHLRIFSGRAAYHAPALNPACTSLINLTKSEEELLAGMHPKTRYNIRVSERHGVNVRLAESIADQEAFFALMDETSRRDRFVQHDRSYLEATLNALTEAGMGRLRLAEWRGSLLAASMEVMYGDTLTYLYGASSSIERHRMAPAALHWQAIRDAKREGYGFYDFWGINPRLKTSLEYKSSWEGITHFKRGWGGREVALVGTWDVPHYPRMYRFIFRHR